MEQKNLSKSTRKTDLDILRILAMLMVYYVHTDIYGNTHYSIAGSKPSYWIGIFTTVVAAAGPTVFFFLSGTLLLNRKFEPGKKYFWRVAKYGIVCIIGELFQFFMIWLQNPEFRSNPIPGILKNAYSYGVILQYWFLFSYFAFLLMLPLLQSMVQNMSNKTFQYFFAVYILLDGVLYLVEKIWRNDRFLVEIPIFTMSIMAPMLGYYLENRLPEKVYKTKNLIIVSVVATVCVGISMVIFSKLNTELPISGMALAVFFYWILRMLFRNREVKAPVAKVLAFCSMGSLVVYLIDPQMHQIFRFIPEMLTGKLPWIIGGVLWVICSLTCGILIAGLLRLIPGVKKLFGG